MARRPETFRILEDDFHKFLAARDASGLDRWPAQAKLFRFLRETLRIAASERDYTTLRQHGVAPEMLVRGLFFFLCQLDRRALADYRTISRRSLPEDPHSLVESLSMVVSKDLVFNHRFENVSWLDIPALVGGAVLPEEPFCRMPTEVDEVCEWTYLEVGRLLAKERGLAPDAKAIEELAAAAMQRSLAEFQQQARDWWVVSPWILSRITLRGLAFATATVLPLKAQAFEALRAGDLADREICATDLCAPSRYALMYALADRPRSKPPKFAIRESATKLFSMYWQVAELTGEMEPVAPADPIQLLAVGVLAERRPALQRAGWIPVEQRLAGMNAHLMQLTLPARGTAAPVGSIASNLQRWALDRVIGLVQRQRKQN